jgi:hypothetical protein
MVQNPVLKRDSNNLLMLYNAIFFVRFPTYYKAQVNMKISWGTKANSRWEMSR